VASNLPFVVTLICSPEFAFSRYFKRLALKSLMFTVCMTGKFHSLYNVSVQYSLVSVTTLLRRCPKPDKRLVWWSTASLLPKGEPDLGCKNRAY